MVKSDSEASFRLDGYAQSNKIAFADNSDDNVIDSASFTVEDNTLEKEKQLFSLPFEAGLDWSNNWNPLTKYANIPVFTTDDSLEYSARLGSAEYSGGKPHLLRLSDTLEAIPVTTSGVSKDYPSVTHISANVILTTYYDKLANGILKKAKILRCKMYLRPDDIEGFDPFIPVYLRQHGKYFYVNKIEDFIEGEITTVELIKM